jgi:ferric-dicitrate binding protein FerR (iron transport regulator)
MIQYTTDNTHTDRAWHLLYARLLREGLVAPAEKAGRPAPRVILPARLRTVAAVLILCMAGLAALTFLYRHSAGAGGRLLSLHNGKGSVTLVTTLEDGSVVYLADDTQLDYPEHFMPDRREVALRGRAMFEVQGNSRRPFRIQTGAAQVEVTGTSFHLQSADNRSFELAVRQGEVKVTEAKHKQSLYAVAGETVRLSPSGYLRVEQTTDTEQFRRYGSRLRFKDETLANILRVINAASESGVLLQTTPALEKRKITVTFADATPLRVAELICMAFNLVCEEKNNILFISEP